MDVTDAVKSCRSPERRREILKDPHVGSFAVIVVLLLVLAQFAFFASVGRETPLWVLVFVPAVSRCCSTLAVTVLPAMSTSQYAEQKKPRGHVAVLSAKLLSFLTAAVMFCGRYALFLGAVLAGYGLTLRQGYRSLGA